ncbi:dihydroorotate dehydrogenase [Anaerosporomusa subterranea]|uniref:Dihydroorotate dehydrogenase B (NAD(+)), electron transfer subunit n=1 Tax=Anaerosporomusa subterranea TaxID=1794912 RepID=A0A154BTX2_ANASB|nr:dihydroorotate dehydrogenase electron transfer subunit [Anaerosporomusa subterranea]KYZ77369.1 dihydroorotate dehydrogenase [Anaerosporomusa subterranea]
MSKLCDTTVKEHIWLAPDVRLLVLHAPELAQQAKPGQFVHIRIGSTQDPLLRRPISICQADPEEMSITLVYRIAGRGTQMLAEAKIGDMLDCLGPLGHGFSLNSERPLLVGGGMGLAPLVFLAQQLCPRRVSIVMGGRSKQELYWTDLFESLCDNIHITTNDGSLGRQGVTLDMLPELLADGDYDRIYACGPRPMLEGVVRAAQAYGIPSELSLEEHMACGIGACLVCTCDTVGGRKKVCSDGPVFPGEDIRFD